MFTGLKKGKNKGKMMELRLLRGLLFTLTCLMASQAMPQETTRSEQDTQQTADAKKRERQQRKKQQDAVDVIQGLGNTLATGAFWGAIVAILKDYYVSKKDTINFKSMAKGAALGATLNLTSGIALYLLLGHGSVSDIVADLQNIKTLIEG